MSFVSADVERQLSDLGFMRAGLGMEMHIGTTKIHVVEGPMLMISISCFGSRSVCSYDVECPRLCSKEQIAGLIYVNMALNFRSDADAFKLHLQSLGLPLFQ